MRKLIAFAAAIAVMVVFAFTILSDKVVLSFSEPLNIGVENTTPPNQAQPQDFGGSGLQFSYFGPDFYCQIYTDFRVRCFGSDEHGVVSDVPNETGFTQVDGGDTYACAANEIDDFVYCWGAITLRPTTIQPTVEPTIEPTPTEVVGTAVPTVEATVEPTVEPAPELHECQLGFPNNVVLPLNIINGSWSEDCVYPVELDDVAAGDRYYKFIWFEALVSASWVATLESSEDTVLLLYEWDTERETWVFTEMNDDIVFGNTNSRIEWDAIAGQRYLLDITTYNANTLGDFTLTLEGQAGSAPNSLIQPNTQGAMPFERQK